MHWEVVAIHAVMDSIRIIMNARAKEIDGERNYILMGETLCIFKL